MALSKAKEEVRDAYFGDLPEELRVKVMNVHKFVVDAANAEFKKNKYSTFNTQQWAKTMLAEFLTMPADKSIVGSVRVYKRGKRYRCMIQLTGHVVNNRNTEDEEYFHGLIRNVHTAVRSKVRRKFDMTLSCESEHGEHFEGFDLYTKGKVAAELWERFADKKSKVIKPMKESTEPAVLVAGIDELPPQLQHLIESTNKMICEYATGISSYETLSSYGILESMSGRDEGISDIGHTVLRRNSDGIYEGSIIITPPTDINHLHTESCDALDQFYEGIWNAVVDEFNESNPTKELMLTGESPNLYFEFTLAPAYVEKLWEYLEESENNSDKNALYKKLYELYHQYDDIYKRHFDIDNKIKIFYDIINKALSTAPEDIKECFFSTDINEYNIGGGGNGETLFHNVQMYSWNTETSDTDLVSRFVEFLHNVESESQKAFKDSKLIGELYFQDEPYTSSFTGNTLNHEGVLFWKYTHDELLGELPPEAKAIYTEIEKIQDQLYGHHDDSVNESVVWDPFMEDGNSDTQMSEAEAKKTLNRLSQNIIDDCKKSDYRVTQYIANTYANIISKSLLPLWANGYRNLKITLDNYQSFFNFEFKIPTMDQGFVARFIEGKENIDGFLHRDPEIRIKMSPRIFHTMKNPDDAFNFFKAAIKYYASGVENYSDKLMTEVMKMNREMKHLVATTKLSGIVTCPMQMLFVFDDVQMGSKDTFKISKEDINTVNRFIRDIYANYSTPEKEKKEIIEDLEKIVTSFRENCEPDENITGIAQFVEAVKDYFDGKFESQIAQYNEQFIYENLDLNWCNKNPNREIRYLQEKFGVKKLKKIPTDLVAYITIETEAIRDANDKMMIASYCLSKIEIVEWYIELLEVGSKKYIVPHSKPYLESVRTQLLACYKKIMAVKIQNPTERPIIDIKYPKGYEG